MGSLWSFLTKPKNQKTLSWLGAGAVVDIGGRWAAYSHFYTPKSPEPQVNFPTTKLNNSKIIGFPIGIQNEGCLNTELNNSSIEGALVGILNQCHNEGAAALPPGVTAPKAPATARSSR